MSERIVNDLYKFIKTGVTMDQLLESNKTAYGDVVEGKLPADPSQVKTPDKEIQLLSEEEKKEKKSKEASSETPPAPMTDKSKKTKLEKEMDAATPDVDKKSDFEVAAGVKKDKKADEGKLPADPSQVKAPDKEVQTMSEGETEKPFTTVSDEEAAKVIVGKMPGSRYEKNKEGGFVVYVKEEKTSEPKDKKVTDTVPEVKAEKGVDKLTNEATPAPAEVKKEEPVAEEKTSEPKDKKVTDTVPEVKAEKGVDKLTNEEKKVNICAKCQKEKCECVIEAELTDEQAQEIAEKLFVVEFLESKKKVTEKQKAFIEEAKKKKYVSDMNKQKVGKALDQLKAHKGKKS